MQTHVGWSYFTKEVQCFYGHWNGAALDIQRHLTKTALFQTVDRLLTLKTGVPKRFPTETFVILHSVDDYGPAKYVCKNKNVGLLQA